MNLVWNDVQLHGVPTFRAVQAVLRREGIRGLYGGVAAAGLGAGCAAPQLLPMQEQNTPDADVQKGGEIHTRSEVCLRV